MPARSLAQRLFFSAALWTVVILIATGFALSSLYRQGVERTFDRRINLHLRTLIAHTAPPHQAAKASAPLGEPMFELPLSGWYWQIARLDGDQRVVQASRSLWDHRLPTLPAGEGVSNGGVRQGYLTGPDEQRLRMIERVVDFGSDGIFRVSVAGEASEIAEETRTFDTYLAVTFLVLAAGLLLTTLFQVRYGLRPLNRITARLADIRSGRADRLDGEFPREIAPLARETNALIDANRDVVERARTHVGNLAHALKTPLSVLLNEAALSAPDPLAAKVAEQAGLMRDQVTRHLERARIAARQTTVGTVTDIEPVIAAIARTMEKLHHDRAIAIVVSVVEGARFPGERQDLEEMVGNLMDNACKWAAGRVTITVTQDRVKDDAKDDATPPARLVMMVDDDGPGLAEADCAAVIERGRRLDESKPGSGLGLSIVAELARLYRGTLALARSPLGGLRATLALPLPDCAAEQSFAPILRP